MHKKDKFYLSLLISVFLITRLLFLFQPFEEIDGYALPDDTYLSLKIAKNIAEGKGMSYTGIPTNGFQPLYVFMMVPVYAIVKTDLITPVYIALIMLSVFSLFSSYLIYRLILLLFGNREAAFFTAFAFIITPAIIRNTTNGLETSISLFFFLLIVFLLYKYFHKPFPEINSKKIFVAGLLLGLAALSRIDNMFLFIALAIWTYIKFRNEKPDSGIMIRKTLTLTAGFAVFYLPWLIISYAHTGMIYPVSGSAVRIQGIENNIHKMNEAGYIIFLIYTSFKFIFMNYFPIIISAVALSRNGFRYVKKIFNGRHLPVVITSVLLYITYIFYIPAYWFYPRYMIFLAVPLLILLGYTAKEFFTSRLGERYPNLAFYSILIIFLAVNISRPGFRDFYFADYPVKGYFGIGKYVTDNFSEGSIIGSLQTGAIAYFAENMIVFNLDGVVNAGALNAIKEKRLMDYIRENRIEYLLSWDINYEFLKLKSQNFRESDLKFLYRTDGLKSWDYEWNVYKVNY